MKKLISKFLIFLMLVVSIPQLTSNDIQAAVTAKYTARYVSTVDGDTVKLKVNGKQYTFRLLAVDTPETKNTGGKNRYMGSQATSYVRKTLSKAKKIQVQYETSARIDKYGRKLAWIFADGKLLQSQLVSKGYARVYYLYGNYKYNNTLKKLEQTTKKKKLGIWKNYKAAFPDSSDPGIEKPTPTPAPVSNVVYIPKTGKKYHRTSTCSSMRSPTKTTLARAQQLGYTACKKCY